MALARELRRRGKIRIEIIFNRRGAERDQPLLLAKLGWALPAPRRITAPPTSGTKITGAQTGAENQ